MLSTPFLTFKKKFTGTINESFRLSSRESLTQNLKFLLWSVRLTQVFDNKQGYGKIVKLPY